MIGYFPNPYPDEMIYSIISRYSLSSSSKETFEDLFTSKNARFRTDIFYFASEMEESLRHFNFYNAEEILGNFTFFEYHSKFLNGHFKKELKEDLLINKNYRSLIHKYFDYKIELFSDVYLKYCDKCYEEDLKTYGEPYWRISHNLPGIKVCIKHSQFLTDSIVKTYSSKLVPLALIRSESANSRGISGSDFKKIKMLNQLTLDLFKFNGALDNIKTMTLYIAFLYDLGYIKNGFDGANLKRDFLNFYSDKLCEILKVDKEKTIDLIIQYINDSLKNLHPLIHILFLVFCKKNINDLTNG